MLNRLFGVAAADCLKHPAAATHQQTTAMNRIIAGIRATVGIPFRRMVYRTGCEVARKKSGKSFGDAMNARRRQVVDSHLDGTYNRNRSQEKNMAEETAFEKFIRAEAKKLRAADSSPKTRDEWQTRRKALLQHISDAIGPVPDKPCELEPQVLGTLERDGYKIEKLVFQSRPDVWVTATAYVPALKDGKKVSAVLVVHGHWAGARRDPVVQARCLGLVKLGFFVLAVDAFGAGERFTKPALGSYHGALYGSTLWPTGHTLLGMQVYDNRRAIDYLLTRKEVNGKFGVTGASGGGNQSMYAGALDDRIQAVVPVCSVGNYQAYLHAACCVCEVLPGALTFTEEGDVLGLVAPRALLVMNASRDGIQFSPAEADKSLARAKDIYKVLGEPEKVKHVVFQSGHDYNKPMREAMYGWMTLHLKGEGKGEPIPEPAHTIEKVEDLACYPNPDNRPKGFLTPPLFAGKVGRELVAKADKLAPTHPEMWEATANGMRAELAKLIGKMPTSEDVKVRYGDVFLVGQGSSQTLNLISEPGVDLSVHSWGYPEKQSAYSRAIVVSLTELEQSGKLTKGLELNRGTHFRLVPRALGKNAPKSGAIGGAPDHNPAEHGLWTGKPLIAQWTKDTVALLLALRAKEKPYSLIGIGQGALIATFAALSVFDNIRSLVLIEPLATLVTNAPYAGGTQMGILVPGLLRIGDVPHLAALMAPRRLIIAGGVSPQGMKLSQEELETAFAFTSGVYKTLKAADKLTIVAEPDWNKIEF